MYAIKTSLSFYYVLFWSEPVCGEMLGLCTSLLLISPKISIMLKREESRVKIVLETPVESGLVEALGNSRIRNYMLSSKYCGAGNAVPYGCQTS